MNLYITNFFCSGELSSLTRNRKHFGVNGNLSAFTEAVSQHDNRFVKTKTDEFIPTADGRLTEEEMMEKGSIPVSTYKTYIKLAGGYMLSIFVLSLFAVNVIGSGSNG